MQQNLMVIALTALSLPGRAYAQADTAPDLAAESDWSAVLYILLVILIFAIALFVWFQRKQSTRQSRDD